MKTDNYLLLKLKQLFALDGNLKKRFADVNSALAESNITRPAALKLNKNGFNIARSNKSKDSNSKDDNSNISKLGLKSSDNNSKDSNSKDDKGKDNKNNNNKNNSSNKINLKRFWFYAESIGEVKIALYLCDLIKRNIDTETNRNTNAIINIANNKLNINVNNNIDSKLNINGNNNIDSKLNINANNNIYNKLNINGNNNIDSKINIKRNNNINSIDIKTQNSDNPTIPSTPIFFISIRTASAYKILENYNWRNCNNNNNNNNKDIIYFFHPVSFFSFFFNSYAALIKPDYFISIENSINSKSAEILYDTNNNIKIYLLDLNLKKEKFLKNYRSLNNKILNNIYVNITNDEYKTNLEKYFSCLKSEKETQLLPNAEKTSARNSCGWISKDFKKVLLRKEKINIIKISDLPLKIASSFSDYRNENNNNNIEENIKKDANINKNADIKEGVNVAKAMDIEEDVGVTKAIYLKEKINVTKAIGIKKVLNAAKDINTKEDVNKDINEDKNARSIVISFISVHKKEIVFLTGILQSVNEYFLQKNINLKFIFAPRNIKAVHLIKKIAKKNGFKVTLYKKDNADINVFVRNNFANNNTENKKNYKDAAQSNKANKYNEYKGFNILIIDDYGKLAQVYKKSDIIYVGKSLFKEESGGHNILEPILYSKAVITGPYIDNFKNIADIYIKNDAIVIIKKDFFLTEFIEFIENEAKWKDMGKNSYNIFKKQKEKTTKNLNCFIKNEFVST
jgi:hypothetical protein